MSLDNFLDWILEKELQELPSNDVRSYPAYHGKINRQTAEVLLGRNGQFLVRQSRSNQFVLSTNCAGEHLHFIIHEKSSQNDDKNLSTNLIKVYYFENDTFPTITSLIQHYVKNCLPITIASQTIITTPINRQTPIESSKYVAFYKKNIHKTWQELTNDFNQIQEFIQYDDHESTSSNKSQKNHLSSSNSSSPSITSQQELICSTSCEVSKKLSIYSVHLEKLSNGISAISLEASHKNWNNQQKNEIYQFTDIHLPALLCGTDSGTLAEHLFRCDLSFFGIYPRNTSKNDNAKMNSSIEFALLPIGKQFRRDVIVRNECLKYFVIATLLKQTNCFETQIELLSKWIRIAAKLGLEFGDQFGFGSIMYGLLDPKIGRQKTLWHGLKSRVLGEFQLFESCLVPKFLALLDSSLEICSSNVCLPFLISIFHMIECNSISNDEFLPKIQNQSIDKIIDKEIQTERGTGLGNFTLDSILSGIIASSRMIDCIEQFDFNSHKILSNNASFQQYDNISALFMTGFHLQFFFGSNIDADKINYRIFQTLELRL